MSNIAIVGAGWLGFPLAKCLVKGRHKVYASTTSKEPTQLFANAGIEHFVTKLAEDRDLLTNKLVPFFQNTNIEIVIGCFPPGFRKGLTSEYAVWWQQLAYCAKQAGVKKLIMISSTSVYPDKPEHYLESYTSAHNWVSDTELFEQSDFSEKAKVLLRAEQAVIDSQINYSIIRCAGLFGPNRNPARFVTKMKQISSKAPANMLHLDDAIGVIQFSLQNLNNEVVNACSPIKVSKEEFYRHAFSAMPTFGSDKQTLSEIAFPVITTTQGKEVSSEKLVNLGYQFKFTNPVDGLAHC